MMPMRLVNPSIVLNTHHRDTENLRVGEDLGMFPSPAASLPPESHQQLYQRLVDGDPTAPGDFAATFLEPLIEWLSQHNPSIDPDLTHEAAETAVLAVIRDPGSYHPWQSSLETYLRMSAQGDLKNLLRKETRHRRRHERLEIVELSDEGGKYTGQEEDPSFPLMLEEELARITREVPDAVRRGLTAVE